MEVCFCMVGGGCLLVVVILVDMKKLVFWF